MFDSEAFKNRTGGNIIIADDVQLANESMSSSAQKLLGTLGALALAAFVAYKALNDGQFQQPESTPVQQAETDGRNTPQENKPDSVGNDSSGYNNDSYYIKTLPGE